MKNSSVLIFVVLFFGCTSKKAISDKHSVSTVIGEIDKFDSGCLDDIAKAKSDFKKKEVYGYITPEGYVGVRSTRYFDELKELLNKQNIHYCWEVGVDSHKAYFGEKPNEGEPYVLNYNCYQRTMNRMIDQKYGADFIPNLKKQADTLYVLRRTNEIFSYGHVDDTLVVYAKSKYYGGMRDQINNDFIQDFKFPIGFIDNEKKNNFVSDVQFTIYKNATISDFVIKTRFENKDNDKFKQYFEKEIIDFLMRSKWKAATALKITVNSSMHLTLHDENYFNR